MSACWSDIVGKLFERLEELIIVCPGCSPTTQCINELSRSPPMDIKILGECCACLLENVLETAQNVPRMYSSTSTDEEVTIYRLGDAVVEISTTNAIVVPASRLESYLELLSDAEYKNMETIRRWLLEVDAPTSCFEEP